MLKIGPEDIDSLPLIKAVKRPIPIRCVQMQEAFEVQTMEGTLQGKAGDWLMVGIEGELYPCDSRVFEKTYKLLPES